MNSSYQIQLEEKKLQIKHRDGDIYADVLQVGFNPNLSASGDRIAEDALKQLNAMINSGAIAGGECILIDGPQTVAVGYVICHKLAHIYSIVAVLDPKIASRINAPADNTVRCKNYIVVSVHGSQKYKVGDVIEIHEQKERSLVKLVLCGPPHSGKSCLREGLKQAILDQTGAPYPYIITGCRDGEGSWFQKAYEINKALAEYIKSKLKAPMTARFAKIVSEWVKGANQFINIIDVGGKITKENKVIMRSATHAVILSGDADKFSEWEKFCSSLNLKIVAKIHSQLDATQDEVFIADNWKQYTNEYLEKAPLLAGSVHRLQRGEDTSTRPMIQKLAEVLIHLTKC